jgi:hypothetical protein
MTRWVQEFDQSSFKSTWSSLVSQMDALGVDDQTVTTTVEELARLKKIVAFIDAIIRNADQELTPKAVWVTCQGQVDQLILQVQAYASNRGAPHLVAANDHADNLLTYVRPYMVAPAQALDAYGAAVQAFAGQVAGHARAIKDGTAQAQEAVKQTLADARERMLALAEIEQRIRAFNAYLFESSAGSVPTEQHVKRMVEQVRTFHDEVEELHESLLGSSDSTSMKVDAFEREMAKALERLATMITSATTERKDLHAFYVRIFGPEPADDDEVRQGGLKDELDTRMRQLAQVEEEQLTRHTTLFTKIEALLPGATSAGLASAYKKLKDDFETSIRRYTQAFYMSLFVLAIGGLVVVTDSVTFWPPSVKFVQAHDWQGLLQTLLTRLPVVLPVVWLAIYSATRRSQYERLQQEYAHKEAFASSYESYKKQLQDLKVDADALQRELIAKAIEAIAFNASKTLDGNHLEKPPAAQLLDKLSLDEIKKLVEMVKAK